MTKDIKKREIRTTPCNIRIRESAPKDDGTQDESRTIEGCAIVFNKESQVLDDDWEPYREIIAPSCITKEFLNTQDVRLNVMHDRKMTFARCNKGQGNLHLEIREDGLYFSVEAPKDFVGDMVINRVHDGVFAGCSFEFIPKDYAIYEMKDADGKSYTLVTHKAFESLGALTIAMDPAYTQTTVNARELEKQTPQYKEREKSLLQQKQRQREAELARAQILARQRMEDYD